MATKLFLRSTTNNLAGYQDLELTAGGSVVHAIVNTAASGTNIQWTDTAGGNNLAWITRPFTNALTLTTTDINIWASESGTSANAGGRYKLYRYTAGAEADTLGGPFDDGVEFTKNTSTLMTWVGNITDVAFSAGDRLVLKMFITNVGTMGGSQTCSLDYDDDVAGATGDSFLNINESIIFSYIPSVSDSSTISDTPTIQLVSYVNVSESSAITDTPTLSLPAPNLAPSVSDSSAIADTPTINELSYINVSDSSTVSDTPTIGEISFVSKSDSSTISDTPTLSGTLQGISVIDTTVVGDMAGRPDDTAFVFESVSITLPVVSDISLSISDSSTVADAAIIVVSDPQVSVSDSTSVSDSPTPSPLSYISVIDTSTMGESVIIAESSTTTKGYSFVVFLD